MSSSSSMLHRPGGLLHLVEHRGERRLEPERLLDLVGAHVGILPVFEEARALVLPDEFDEGRGVRLPIFGEPFEVLEDRVDAVFREERHGVLGVLIEVGVEDALIHEVRLRTDVEEHPAQVVQLEHLERVGQAGDGLLDLLSIRADGLLRAGLDLRDDREAIARGSLGEDRAVSSLFLLEESLLRDRLGGGLRPVVLHVSLPAFLVMGLRPVVLDFRVGLSARLTADEILASCA